MRIPKISITHSAVKSQNFDGKKKDNLYLSQPNMSLDKSKKLDLDKSKKDTFCLSKKK